MLAMNKFQPYCIKFEEVRGKERRSDGGSLLPPSKFVCGRYGCGKFMDGFPRDCKVSLLYNQNLLHRFSRWWRAN